MQLTPTWRRQHGDDRAARSLLEYRVKLSLMLRKARFTPVSKACQLLTWGKRSIAQDSLHASLVFVLLQARPRRRHVSCFPTRRSGPVRGTGKEPR